MIVGNQFSRALVLVKAKSVQERLGDNFYAVFDADYLLVLERGLLVQVPGALDLAGDLSRSGFRLGVDFGLGRPGEEGFVACEGIAYGGFGVPPCSTEPWTEDCLPDAVRSRRRTLEDHRRRARETVEQSALDAACAVAAAEGIPTRIQDFRSGSGASTRAHAQGARASHVRRSARAARPLSGTSGGCLLTG